MSVSVSECECVSVSVSVILCLAAYYCMQYSRRFIARERGESRERDARGTTKAVGTTSPTWIALTLERLERETRARRSREA